jgi:hypothetical protein
MQTIRIPSKVSFDLPQDLILVDNGKETPIHKVLHFQGEIKSSGWDDGRSGYYGLPLHKSHWQ